MRKIFYLIIVVVFLSCSNDEEPRKSHEFLNSVTGNFWLKSIYTDVPVDLNFDGISQTNVIDEGECFTYYPIGIYRSEFSNNEAAHYTHFFVTIPHTYNDSDEKCIDYAVLFYDFKVDEINKSIIITQRDEEREAIYGHLNNVKYSGGNIYFEFEKDLLTSEGWKIVTLYMEYGR